MEKENIKKEEEIKKSSKKELIQQKGKAASKDLSENKAGASLAPKGREEQAQETPQEKIKEAPTPTEGEAGGPTKSVGQKPEIEKKEPKEDKPNIKKFRTIASVKPRRPERIEEKKEFEEKVLEIRRVARVVRGGRRFKFRAAVVVGNRTGKIGIGVGKGSEVTGAVSKAVARAKKNMVEIKLINTTIPFDIKSTFKGAEVLLKPARKGTGLIAGGAVRAVLESAGISDISSKMLGSASKISNMVATFEALKKLSRAER